jgi:hypothetical protein
MRKRPIGSVAVEAASPALVSNTASPQRACRSDPPLSADTQVQLSGLAKLAVQVEF